MDMTSALLASFFWALAFYLSDQPFIYGAAVGAIIASIATLKGG